MTIAADVMRTKSPSSADARRELDEQVRHFAHHDYRRVVATVALWCGSIDDATEAVADALGRTWEQLDNGNTIDNLAAFVTVTAMNAVRTKHRRNARFQRKRHLLAVTNTSDGPSIERLDVARALATLAPRQREIVALHYGADLSITEIANSLGVAQGTVKATLHHARGLLAEQLSQGDDHE